MMQLTIRIAALSVLLLPLLAGCPNKGPGQDPSESEKPPGSGNPSVPSVTAVVPSTNAGLAALQNLVTIQGTGFQTGLKLLWSGQEIVPTSVSDTEIKFPYPSDTPPGPVGLSVNNPDNGQITVERAFFAISTPRWSTGAPTGPPQGIGTPLQIALLDGVPHLLTTMGVFAHRDGNWVAVGNSSDWLQHPWVICFNSANSRTEHIATISPQLLQPLPSRKELHLIVQFEVACTPDLYCDGTSLVRQLFVSRNGGSWEPVERVAGDSQNCSIVGDLLEMKIVNETLYLLSMTGLFRQEVNGGWTTLSASLPTGIDYGRDKLVFEAVSDGDKIHFLIGTSKGFYLGSYPTDHLWVPASPSQGRCLGPKGELLDIPDLVGACPLEIPALELKFTCKSTGVYVSYRGGAESRLDQTASIVSLAYDATANMLYGLSNEQGVFQLPLP